MDGSQAGAINGMDLYEDWFVTGGSDRLIKVWQYDEGDITHIGEYNRRKGGMSSSMPLLDRGWSQWGNNESKDSSQREAPGQCQLRWGHP